MKSEDAQRYCVMMAEVKARTRLIREFGAGEMGPIPLPAAVELIYLHLRKTLELVAMGSLLANAKAFGTTHDRLKKYWNAKDLLRDLDRINPHFYPLPIIQTPSVQPGILMDWNDRKDDFLTKDRFISLYDICGGVLHSRNPFRPDPDYQKLLSEAPKWTTWIVHLLNSHTIRLAGSANLYLIQMGKEDSNPTYTTFEKK